MVFSLAFGGLILPCNGSLTLNQLCISDCYVIPEGTWRSRGRGTGDFIITNPHYLVSRSCIVTLLSSCHSFLLTLANTFVSALGNYWATPTGEAQFRIRSFICVGSDIPMGRLLCCTISLVSS